MEAKIIMVVDGDEYVYGTYPFDTSAEKERVNGIAAEIRSQRGVCVHVLQETEDAMKNLNGSGYLGVEAGIFVPEEGAYAYALERISLDEGLKKEFVEWFYSGSWIKED